MPYRLGKNLRSIGRQATLHIQLVEDRALAEARFGVIPHLFIGIELRGLGRQERQEDVALLLLDEALGCFAMVVARVIGDDQYGFPGVLVKLFQEVDKSLRVHPLLDETESHVTAPGDRTDDL